MTQPEPTPLEKALANACALAITHGVDPTIRPRDFGIQRSEAGRTCATYVDSSHAVTVDIDERGVTFGVAELEWLHFPDPEAMDDEDCTFCHPDRSEPTHYRGVPLITVHLPEDAPSEEPAHV